MINIGLCSDERYAMPCGICIQSIFLSNKNEDVCIHVLTNGFSHSTLSKFKRLESKFDQKIEIVSVDDSVFNNYPITSQFQKSIYYRFLFAELLDQSISRLLYLDCDILVMHNISELFSMDLNSNVCGVVEDQESDYVCNWNRLNNEDGYFNSGVLLMDLNRWRTLDISRKCMKYIKDFPEKCVYPDQDALNVLLKGKVFWLDPKYNVQEEFYWKNEYRRIRKSKWKRIDESIVCPFVLHYCGPVKPWKVGCQHPLRNSFLSTLKSSYWKHLYFKFLFMSLLVCLWNKLKSFLGAKNKVNNLYRNI